jgi:hypothetical protein
MRGAAARAIVEFMVTPKRVFETTPLVVAQIQQRERLMRARERAAGAGAPHHEPKRDRLTTSQKFGRT